MTFLVNLAKDAMLRKLGERVQKLDRTYVVRWIAGDVWIADTLGRNHERELRAWKNTVLETLDSISPDEMLAACRDARPDLEDLWGTPEAKAKIAAEWERGRAFLEKL